MENLKEKQNYNNKFIVGGNLIIMSSFSELDETGYYKLTNNISIDDSAFGAGVNLRYKIYTQNKNKDSVFFTPEIFYNFALTSGKDNKGYGLFDIELKQSYGFKLSVGVEFDNKHSISIGGIIQNISHTYKYEYVGISYSEDSDSFAYGLALDYEYQMSQNLSFNVGVSGSFLYFDLPNENIFINFNNVSVDMSNTIVNLYVGLNYNF